MDGINASDGRVIHVCGDVPSEMRSVTRVQKVMNGLKTSRDLLYNHGLVAKELKEKFNLPHEQARNEMFDTELGNITIIELARLLAIMEEMDKLEKCKVVGESILKSIYDSRDEKSKHLSKDKIETLQEQYNGTMERLASLQIQYEEKLKAVEEKSKNVAEAIPIAFIEAIELIETKSKEQRKS